MSNEPGFRMTVESCTLASSEPKAESSTALFFFFFERTEDTWIEEKTGRGVQLGSRTDSELKWGSWRDSKELWG